jgi:hypothetical protein
LEVDLPMDKFWFYFIFFLFSIPAKPRLFYYIRLHFRLIGTGAPGYLGGLFISPTQYLVHTR